MSAHALWFVNRFTYVENSPAMKVDPTGLATYICRRPLGGSPGAYAPPLLNHTYVCVRSDGNFTCGSTTASSGGPLANVFGGGTGKPTSSSTDYFHPEACEKEHNDDRCIETCISNELGKPTRPKYGVGPAGDDCHEYTDQIVKMCKQRCVRR